MPGTVPAPEIQGNAKTAPDPDLRDLRVKVGEIITESFKYIPTEQRAAREKCGG